MVYVQDNHKQKGQRTCEQSGWISPRTGSISVAVLSSAGSMPCRSNSCAKREQSTIVLAENLDNFESLLRKGSRLTVAPPPMAKPAPPMANASTSRNG